MNDLDAILLESGLEGLSFGCKPEFVVSKLGDPSESETDEDGDLTCLYEELGLTLTFWADFGLGLGDIGTERPQSHLRGQQLVGKSLDFMKAFIENELNTDVTEEDSCVHEDGHVQTWIEVDVLGITFWFDDGLLYLIDWTCEFNGEVPIWFGSKEDVETAEEVSAPVLVASSTPIPKDLLECWESCYPQSPPVGFLLRDAYPELWVRIHSLPKSKRRPTTDADYVTLLERHNVVATEVLGESSLCAVLLLGSDQTSETEMSELAGLGVRFEKLCSLPAELWEGKGSVFREPTSLFALAVTWDSGAFDPLLRAFADRRVKGLIVELEEGCVYAPYNGGADLFYDSESDRDEAIKRHQAWLPT